MDFPFDCTSTHIGTQITAKKCGKTLTYESAHVRREISIDYHNPDPGSFPVVSKGEAYA
ncbi:MAG: hypothetical protein Alpg2KO_02900 [Alphaproteobacteria bacterium]